jgi:RNA polymerase sigma-70 factor (ECF subfamily)
LSAQGDFLSGGSEALLASMARRGHRDAFAELVRRRETWIRTLLLRCCGHPALADDLAQQVFMQAWKTIGQLRKSSHFGAWLKRLAINTWLQHLRRNDPLRHAEEEPEAGAHGGDTAALAMDLDQALAMLKDHVRMCIVLSYHEGMTHDEISGFTGLPVGTVKSHIRRGTKKLKEALGAYGSVSRNEDQI